MSLVRDHEQNHQEYREIDANVDEGVVSPTQPMKMRIVDMESIIAKSENLFQDSRPSTPLQHRCTVCELFFPSPHLLQLHQTVHCCFVNVQRLHSLSQEAIEIEREDDFHSAMVTEGDDWDNNLPGQSATDEGHVHDSSATDSAANEDLDIPVQKIKPTGLHGAVDRFYQVNDGNAKFRRFKKGSHSHYMHKRHQGVLPQDQTPKCPEKTHLCLECKKEILSKNLKRHLRVVHHQIIEKKQTGMEDVNVHTHKVLHLYVCVT